MIIYAAMIGFAPVKDLYKMDVAHPESYVLHLASRLLNIAHILFLTLSLCAGIFLYLPERDLRTSDALRSVGIQYSATDIAPSSKASKKHLWIFFTDKGNSSNVSEYQYKAQLPIRTRLRRQKAQGNVISNSDLPVFGPYIDGLLKLGTTLRVTSRWLNAVSVEAPDSLITRISKLPYVKSIEPVTIYKRKRTEHSAFEPGELRHPRYAPGIQQPTSSGERLVYGMSATQIQQIRANVLHEKGYDGTGITIALLDTGFDLSHEALRQVRVRAEYDFVNGDGETLDKPPDDDIGQDDHGTEVLSIISGNSPGNFMGVAPAADYLLAKTERVSYRGAEFEYEIEEDWWIAGLEWAEAHGADIVSSSLGYSNWYSYSDLDGITAKTTVAANMAVEKGVVVVVSAGNEGKSSDWPYISAPADGFYVIAVGAVNDGGDIADFSSIGPTYDGRIKPDVVALGDDAYVVDPNSTTGYRKADGTSMATPLVAGTVALLMQAIPDLNEPKHIAKLLKYTATHALSPDNRYGWGIINAEAAFRYGTSPGFEEELKNWDPNGAIISFDRAIVYPNPIRRGFSKGGLTVHSPERIESIRIYSISGSLIYERQDMDSSKFLSWDLKNKHGQKVANGVYICIIKSPTGAIHTEKIAIID
jgi:serine protease AprX